MSKGSTRRKCLISREEESLRYDLAFGKITFAEWFKSTQELKRAHADRIFQLHSRLS